MINLKSFEHNIRRVIVERGIDYYERDAVSEVNTTDHRTFDLTVEGMDSYQVTVEINEKQTIVFSDCECPYDQGPVCKHEVAAYYTIRDLISDEEEIATLQFGEESFSLIQKLQSLSKDELIHELLQKAKENKGFYNQLEEIINKDHSHTMTLNDMKETVKLIIDSYVGQKGYIDYNQTFDVAEEFHDLLREIQMFHDPLLAAESVLFILDQTISSYHFADDSAGVIGQVVTEALELLYKISEKTVQENHSQKADVFVALIEKSKEEVFEGWEEWRNEVLWCCVPFTEYDVYREEFVKRINQLVEEQKSEYEEFEMYKKQELLLLVYEVYQRYEGEEKALELALEYKEYNAFRKKVIEHFIETKEYEEALHLIIESEKKDQEFRGKVVEWKKMHFEVAEALQDIKSQKQLVEELVIAGEFDYYHKLKAIYGNDFLEIYKELKKKLKEQVGITTFGSVYLKVLEYEKDTAELLQVVKEYPHLIESYSDILLPKHKNDVARVYKKFIYEEVKKASTRREYKKVCQKIQDFKKVGGDKDAYPLILDLKEENSHRPAFLDELSKVE